MVADGVAADAQGGGELFLAVAGEKAVEHLRLPGRETGDRRHVGPATGW